jgi:hypothetical protein
MPPPRVNQSYPASQSTIVLSIADVDFNDHYDGGWGGGAGVGYYEDDSMGVSTLK